MPLYVTIVGIPIVIGWLNMAGCNHENVRVSFGALVRSYVAITFVQPALLTMKLNLFKQTVTSATDTLATRRREVENALLVQALCGRQPSSAVKAQLRRYEAGELPRELAFAGLYVGHK
jgi:hypothetical protein